jgi:hypothetical protein
MGEIDDYKRRENIKRMEKLIEYLLCDDKKEYILHEDERKKEYLLHEDERKKEYLLCEDKENKTYLIWIHGEPVSDHDAK